MSASFELIRKAVHKDAVKEPDVISIEEETESSIFVHDLEDGIFDKYYRICDTAIMDKDWLLKRVIITPSLAKASEQGKDLWSVPTPFEEVYGVISDFVMSCIPKETYRTLNRLVLMYDDEQDFDYLQEVPIGDYIEDFDYLLDAHDLPSEHGVGITWTSDCITVIHVKNIKDASDELLRSGEITAAEHDEDVMRGILMTIAHEFRHLQQSNPYQDESTKFLSDPELDAEDFAIGCYSRRFFFREA